MEKVKFVIEKAEALKEFLQSAGIIITGADGEEYHYLPYWVRFHQPPEGVEGIDAMFYELDNLPDSIIEAIKQMRDGQ